MLYRYILALTLTAMCIVNGDETITTASPSVSPSVAPSVPPTSPTGAPTTTIDAYSEDLTVSIPCCFDAAVSPSNLLPNDMCPDSTDTETHSACDAAKFDSQTSFHDATVESEVFSGPTKDDAAGTCLCEYKFQRFTFDMEAADPVDSFAPREVVEQDRWPNLLSYAVWKMDVADNVVANNEQDCHAMMVTECPTLTMECNGWQESGDDSQQLPESLTVDGDNSYLVDYGKSQETWPVNADNEHDSVCYCFWLYSSCPTSAPTAAPTEEMDDMSTTELETGGAGKQSLIATAVILCSSFVFSLL